MRIIKESRLHEYAKQHSRASNSLRDWRTKTRHASWKKPADVKHTLPSADQVTLPNGLQVTVFDIGGNAFRLITVIHYNRGIIYIRKFMTHAEYSKGDWKNDP
jgi:mRNA interferase HigB